MEHLDDLEIKAEIDVIEKRIRSIVQTIKELDSDQEGEQDSREQS